MELHKSIAVILVGAAALAPAFGAELLPRLADIIGQKTTALSDAEREIIDGWSPAKKIAEFFCQDRALAELKGEFSDADRVFLELEASDPPPELVSATRVAGVGSVRHGADWTDFSYECEIDPETAEAIDFRYEAKP